MESHRPIYGDFFLNSSFSVLAIVKNKSSKFYKVIMSYLIAIYLATWSTSSMIQVRRLKEREVTNETTNMEEYLTMEEELTNDQDAVVNNIRDVTSR